ncbi:MAG: ferredoxin [Halohasta sp.]
MSDERPTPSEFGTTDDAPPIEEKPYKIIFEANKCFGAGRCAEASTNWELDLETGVANPRTYFLDESELEENVRAAELCPAKKGNGVIHIIDRQRDIEIAPDPHGDGSLSVDW